jgi:hypothetical protein
VATIYVKSYQEKEKADIIFVGGVDVRTTTLFAKYEDQMLNTTEGETFSGVPSYRILEDANVEMPANHRYILIGSDGYKKEIGWEHIQGSVLTTEGRIVFADLPKQFWVRNIVEIKVL